MSVSDDVLLQYFKENQFLDEAELQKAINLSQQEKLPLYNALIQSGVISDKNLGQVISDYLKLPFVSLKEVSIPDDVLNIIPEKLARSKGVIAFEKNNEGVKIATSNIQEQEFLNMLSQKVNGKVSPYYATELDIEDTLRLYNKDLQKSFDALVGGDLTNKSAVFLNNLPLSDIVDLIIKHAYEDKASDIHIEPHEKGCLVRFRVDGVLHDVLKIPKILQDQIITRIKVLSRLRTDEHLAAQDGKMQINFPEENLDIRVSILPVVEGEKAVLRLLSSRSRQYSLSDLGMADKDLEKVQHGFDKPYGMVLSTGPTGSGKTTLIYSVLKILNTRERNIATIEDPVEYEIDGINQIQVNVKTNLTFANGLRSILRQDPNVIFVGEIRDSETAGIAVNAAMTGHLVLSTLHTNDAATSLPRLVDMGIEPFLVSSTVNVIIAQRLVRKICEKCRVSKSMKVNELKHFFSKEAINKIFPDSTLTTEINIYEGKGCPVCHFSGFVGRLGIFEVLVMSDKIKALINNKAYADEISRQAISEGMTTMLEDGLDKVMRGITTVEEVLRVVSE